mgnify:FL=1
MWLASTLSAKVGPVRPYPTWFHLSRPRNSPPPDRRTAADRCHLGDRVGASLPIALVVVVEEDQCVGQGVVDEVGAAAEWVVERGPGFGLCFHDAGDDPDRDAGVIDPL